MLSNSQLGNAYEMLVAQFLKDFAKPATIAIDGGSHMGLHTSPLSSSVGLHGIVLSFEPIPNLIDRLRIKYRSFPNVQVEPFALGPKVCKQEFFWEIDNEAYSSLSKRADAPPGQVKIIQVEITTIDEKVKPIFLHVSVIKLDLEGSEFGALEGAKRTMKQDRPMIVSEFTKELTLKKQKRTEGQWESFLQEVDYEHLDLFGHKYTGNDTCWYSILAPRERLAEINNYRIWAEGFRVGIHQEGWHAFFASI